MNNSECPYLCRQDNWKHLMCLRKKKKKQVKSSIQNLHVSADEITENILRRKKKRKIVSAKETENILCLNVKKWTIQNLDISANRTTKNILFLYIHKKKFLRKKQLKTFYVCTKKGENVSAEKAENILCLNVKKILNEQFKIFTFL